MARDKDLECRGILVGETDNAICVRKDGSPPRGENWYIPRSQIGYLRKDIPLKSHDPTHVVFTLPEWLIESKQCWDLVP